MANHQPAQHFRFPSCDSFVPCVTSSGWVRAATLPNQSHEVINECHITTRFRGKDGRNEAVIFIPATPGSELQKRFKKVIKEAKVGIAVVELAGTSMKKRLQRSDPFKEDVCRKASKCMVCSGEGGGGEGVGMIVLPTRSYVQFA